VNIVLHPAAAEELQAAAIFYATQANRQLGAALLAEFERVLTLLAGQPELGSVWIAETRRFALRRFPFNVVYRAQTGQLLIVALAHHRRRPGYWRHRS
jgi:toxin ParE1/3/4